MDTAVELRAGQTLALAGLLQIRTESESVGLPVLADLPYLGALFRSNREVQNEVELLIMVTPNFAGAMDAHEVPRGGPGYNSTSPLEQEIYGKGYVEVPPGCAPLGSEPSSICPPNEGPQILYNNAYTPNASQTRAKTPNPPTRAPVNAMTKTPNAGPVGVANQIAVPVRR